MKKVLIALDYAPGAEKIAEQGYALAKAMNASVVLLHVTAEAAYYAAMDYSPIMGFAGFNSFNTQNVTEIVENLEKESERFLNQAKAHLGDDSITTLIADGNAAQTIIAKAGELGADVIVLGSHSRSGLDTILMGSVSKDILKHSRIPLFIIPAMEENA